MRHSVESHHPRRLPGGPTLAALALAAHLVAACAPTVDPVAEATADLGPGSPAPHPFTLGGQRAWFHDEGHGAGVFHTYDAFDACGVPRKLHVFVPRDYGESGARYRVLYALDGDTTFFPGGAAGKSWRVAETLSALLAEGAVEPTLVVAIHPLEREREYTHASWAPTRAWGGLGAHAAEIADCIKPFVDLHYRTRPGADDTLIMGSSHGGLAAFWIATRHPESFGAAISMSPSYWVGLDSLVPFLPPSSASLRRSALVAPVEGLLADRARRPRLWIDWGERRDGGFHNETIERLAAHRGAEMVELLERDFAYGEEELEVVVDPLGGHDEDAWAWRFGLAARRWLAPAR
ncbi:MAG TPA: alpha/beta hydrolase-fold protein [Polyangiaceae bacterium LLY-WYZ-15_(1-7)]|nr:esterase [Myxococcales bacterium]MAT25299.1 esterase [Sandaracinus sp.]HJL06491.1 alpha/beta hydrolase-fold protein [Polyangiaceae bacterium LLY-WYZ-15_(1-7)]MBJ71374.1 esterase [Sandaracinus sp.]HJL12361.1 alpha/beta hydrolase-fold protein [Polyangiaceae bacterium LLY-WYZ-15_(1-7)]